LSGVGVPPNTGVQATRVPLCKRFPGKEVRAAVLVRSVCRAFGANPPRNHCYRYSHTCFTRCHQGIWIFEKLCFGYVGGRCYSVVIQPFTVRQSV